MGQPDGFTAKPFQIRRQHKTALIEMFSGGRYLEFPIFALQQFHAKFLFQRLYLLRNGGL